jgi:hypothetical protein
MIRILLLCLLLVGCGTAPVPGLAEITAYLPELNNRPSMAFDVDGIKYVNYAILDKKPMYMFTFTVPKNTLYFTVTTCSREEFFPKPESGIVKWGYVPLTYLEDQKSCIMTATAIGATGSTTTAIIEFRDNLILVASSKCNGRFNLRTGVDLCISRVNLHSRIEFNYEVVLAGEERCPKLMPAIGFNSYEWQMGKGFCIYKFTDNNKDTFRLTTFGYDTIKDVTP